MTMKQTYFVFLLISIVLLASSGCTSFLNEMAGLHDVFAYIVSDGNRCRGYYSFNPESFSQDEVGKVYRLDFTPCHPRAYSIDVVYPHIEGGRYGWLHLSYEKIAVEISVFRRGERRMKWVNTNAVVVASDGYLRHDERGRVVRWNLGELNTLSFPWYYNNPIEVELKLLEPMKPIDGRYGNGRLELSEEAPLQ